MKKTILLIILFGLILIPKDILAASITLNCPSSVTVGDNIECTVTANHTTISGVKGSVSFSGMNIISANNLTGSGYFSVTNNGFDGAIDIASNSKSIAKYVFSTSSAGTATINVNCIELIDGTNFDTHGCGTASKTITINERPAPPPPQQPSNPNPEPPKQEQPKEPQVVLSNNNNLKKISVEGYELKKLDNNNYSLTVPNDITSVKVNLTAEDAKAKVSGTGNKELNIGENNIELIITAESGAQNKFIIKITRKDGFYLEDLDIVVTKDLKNKDIIINQDSKITKEQIEKIKDSKKEIKFNYYDENKKLIYSWNINGKEINDTNEFITTITLETDKIKDIYETSNYADGLYAKFKHSGNLPIGTKIKLFVGNKFEDKSIVNVYHYNKDKKLELIKDKLEVIDEYIEFDIEHCSNYFITMATIENATVPEEKENNNFILYIIIEFIVILILFVLLMIKINNKKTKQQNNNINESLVKIEEQTNNEEII